MTARGRVLIVDDQPDLVEGLVALMEMEGIDAVVHSSLITLSFVVRAIDPDLILLDLSMPALSGRALLDLGARMILRTTAPVILFSGRDPRELSRLTEELGAHGFLAKQWDAVESIRRIKAWIRQHRFLTVISNERGQHDTARSSHHSAH